MKKLTNIEKCQLIKLVIGDLLFPLGFKFIEHREGSCAFTKKENDVTQDIEFEAYRLDQFYNIRISTSVCEHMKYLTNLILEQPELNPCKSFQDSMLGWNYRNKDELISLLKQFCIIIPIYILPELEKMSIINDPFHIRTEIFDYMRKVVDEIHEAEGKIGTNNKFKDSPAIIIENLSKVVNELKSHEFAHIEHDLANCAIEYGRMLIENFGGQWVWRERTNSIVVSDLGGKQVMSFPLKLMISVWKGEETLQADYQRICSEIPNASECLKVNKKMNWIRHKLGLDWDD